MGIRHRHDPAWGALKIGTISATRFIGLERDIGSIEVGKLADHIS